MARKKGIDFPPSEKSFDPTVFAEKAKQDHAALVEKLTSMGVKPEDIPNAFSKIGDTLEKIHALSEKIGNEKDSKKKDALLVSIQKLGVTLSSARVKAEEAAREHLKVHPPQTVSPVSAPEVQAAEPVAETIDTENLDLDLSEPEPEPQPEQIVPATVDIDFSDPVPEISPEAKKLESEEQRDIDERIKVMRTIGEHLNAEEPESSPAVFRSNRAHPEEKETSEIEVPIIPNPEDALDLEHVQEIQTSEHTPKEWREKLSALINGAKEKLEWWKSAEEGLIRRNAELDAELEKIGGVEKGFRWIGEKYNKLGWKSKLAVGAGLGLGAVVTAGSLAMVFPLLGIAAQRAAGLSTMYLKFEKNSHEQKWGKEKAMLKAGVYTVLMGLAIKEGIEYASETELAHAAQAKVEGWLGSMLGHESVTTATNEGVGAAAPAPVPETVPVASPEVSAQAPTTAVAPEIHQPKSGFPSDVRQSDIDAALKTMTSAPEAVSGMPSISVEASAGHGYEYMAKRLWEQLQEKGLDASKFDANSDMHKLLTADATTIDKIVHQIAADPKHGYFNSDGASIRIDLDSNISIGADGNIELNGAVGVPENASFIPAPRIEVPVPSPSPAIVPSIEHASISESVKVEKPITFVEPSTVVHQEAPAPETQPLATEIIKTPETTVEKVDITDAPALVSQPHVETPTVPAVVEQAAVIQNQFGLNIPTAESHIYTDVRAEHLFVYGGSPAEKLKAIQEYLTQNPNKVVFAADESGKYRLPWHLIEGKITPGAPVRTGGFLGWFSSFMKSPEPEEFEKIIK